MSVVLHRGKGGGLGSIARWLLVAAVIGAVLNAKDIKRYLTIRSM